MNDNETFTILASGAPLVEVQGDGPYSDLPGGLTVSDGVATTAPVHLLTDFVRKWRVDAAPTVQATVAVTDSPLGAYLSVRRCIPRPLPWRWWCPLAAASWPRVQATLKRLSPSMLAVWNLYTDEIQTCQWRDVGSGSISQVSVRGGDVVVVAFESP